MKRFYADENRVVVYEEAPGGGDPIDPNSLMNRPIIAPMSWLANVYFHSDFDYYNTYLSTSIPFSHPARSPGSYSPSLQIIDTSIVATADYNLLDHNLGYEPKFYAAIDNKFSPSSYPIQVTSDALRYVSFYATVNQIRVREIYQVSASGGLSAITPTYQLLVFADSDPDPAMDFLSIEPGNVVFGQGKFRHDQPPMRIAATGETPFYEAIRRTTAVRNGAVRTYLPNGGYVDAGPFNGTLPAPTFVNVQSGLF